MSKRPSKFESVSARNEDSSSGSATHQEAAPTTNVESTTTPSYIVELAKSGRAECKKCGDKIDNKTIRIGVILEGDWGLFTRWQHLSCTVFHASLTSCNAIDGLQDLSREDQIAVENRYESSKGEIDEDMKPLDPDALVSKTWDEAIEPCSDLLMPLLPYQKEGLGWMLHQELSNIHGGILADEMGMGKTIQAVSIILQNRPNLHDAQQMRGWKESDCAHGVSDKGIKHCGTLIVLPTVAIRQWQMEIARFTKEGSLKVKVYHGNDRNTSIDDLISHDVIITSYKILEIEYRKATAGTKVECRICGKKFYPEKLRLHRKYFCGEGAQRTEAQSKTQKKKSTQCSQTAAAAVDSEEEDEAEKDTHKGKKRATPSNSKANKSVAKKPVGSEQQPLSGRKGIRSKTIAHESIDDSSSSDEMIGKMTSTTRSKQSPASSHKGGAIKAPKKVETPGVIRRKATPTRSAAVNAAKSISKKYAEEDEDDDYSEHSDYEEQSQEDEDESEESISDDSTESGKGKRAAKGKRRIPAIKDAKKDKDIKTPNKRRKLEEDLDDASSSETSVNNRSAKKQSGASRNKSGAAKKKGKESSTKVTRFVECPSSSDCEVIPLGNKRKLSGSSSQTKVTPKKANTKGSTTGKKKFPGESSSEDDEFEHDGINAKRGRSKKMPRDSTPSYDEDVEKDIAAALKAHEKQLKKNSVVSILHMVSWFRIILDEAHLIKDRSTSTAKAVFNLISLNKWCLTGTPLQNRVGELYSLIRFLRVDPHAFYFCKTKDCGCKSLHYRFTNGKCDDCEHSVINHFCHFNKHVLNPIQRSGYIADGKKAMMLLKNQILDNILLRRTKINRADDIQLPLRVVKVRQEKLDDKEEDFYQALYTQSQAQFNTYLSSGTVLNNYAHIFDILIRLRQAVDHPYLVIHGESQSSPEELSFTSEKKSSSTDNKLLDVSEDKC